MTPTSTASMPMRSRFATRALALAATFSLAFVVAACSDDIDPIGPGLGLATTDTVFGGLGTDSLTNAPGFAANFTGPVFARVCGPEDANFDAAVINRSRDTLVARSATDTTKIRIRIADTVAKASSATTGCEELRFTAQQGQTYRFVVRSASGRGGFATCYAYEQDVPARTACAALRPRALTPAGVAPGYYDATSGLSGTALLTALHDISRTRHNGFLYDSARGFLFQDVEDPDDDNLIEDLYAGRISTVDRRANSTTDAGDANLNAEHTWPQSCGARLDRVTTGQRATGPRGDLHVIFSADAPANGARSNDPYGVVTGAPTASFGPDSAGSFSRRGPGVAPLVFEPRAEKKGDVARAIFYFYVRYVPEIPMSLSLANFNVEEATLLQWAQQDPPDAFERARNDEVAKVQGNRNPFVDNPAFLTAIGDFPNAVAGTAPTCSF